MLKGPREGGGKEGRPLPKPDPFSLLLLLLLCRTWSGGARSLIWRSIIHHEGRRTFFPPPPPPPFPQPTTRRGGRPKSQKVKATIGLPLPSWLDLKMRPDFRLHPRRRTSSIPCILVCFLVRALPETPLSYPCWLDEGGRGRVIARLYRATSRLH